MLPISQKNELLLATRNLHKIREIEEIFVELPILFLTLKDFPQTPEIIEDGKSFKENALKKALSLAQWSGKTCLADDSGIEVDFLNGAPGIYSARFAGEKASDEENNEKLLRLLREVPLVQRTARYQCVMALATPKGKTHTEQGTCEGLITSGPKGKGGFGYDPVFFYPPFKKTFGETDPVLKDKVSHRYHALEKIKPLLSQWLGF
ncbi:MAG: XTP/dITP diphosphatase [Chlamydiae bacterium]|nr:XTP/dITP diphosphatase [Chlamydiota bacterium]MBI3277691.1 XTP/dITP diphosphatase [Chlamydiota bacterium]